jgi:hypothetical protein
MVYTNQEYEVNSTDPKGCDLGAVCVCKIIPILQRNKFRSLHLILTPLVRELTDKEKMCDNPHPLQEVDNVQSKIVNVT